MFLLLFNYVQVMVRGCPLGYMPAFDTKLGLDTVKGCETITDCPLGTECVFSPISPVFLCCKQDASFSTDLPLYDSPGGGSIFVTAAGLDEMVNSTMTTGNPAGIRLQEILITVTAAAAKTVAREEPTPLVNHTHRVVTVVPEKDQQNGDSQNDRILVPLPGVWARLPDVRPVLIGRLSALLGRTNVWQRYGSVTLVRDGGYNILVDTGSGPRLNDVKAGLASLGVTPAQVHMVILTHGHPDHFGNTQLFPMAQYVYGNYLYKGEEFLDYGLSRSRTVKLTDNVEIWSTPGHTSDSLTVIVRNVPYGGVVAVTGDLFIGESDLDEPGRWINTSTNIDVQMDSRNYVICRVNWIVPGHDKMFKITNATRVSAGCLASLVEPSIPLPQLPQHSSYEEQNAIRYAYYAYNILDRPSQFGTNAVPVMNDQSSAPIAPNRQQYITQMQQPSAAVYSQQPMSPRVHPSMIVPVPSSHQSINQKSPGALLGMGQQQQPQAPGNGQCCVYGSVDGNGAGGQGSPWQQAAYRGVTYTGEGGIPPIAFLGGYRNGKKN